jgi:NAD(P)-dependent dehydrogenase (short-subunit alcohol dehydrogenase family)
MEALSDRMKARSCIVIVGGPSGNGGWPGWVRSGAARAAAYQIAQAEAATFGPREIRVNGIAVGVTEDLAGTIAAETGTTVAAVKLRIPTRQWMTSEALENTLLFLLHPSSSFISGEVVVLDGGWNVWGRLNAIERVQ